MQTLSNEKKGGSEGWLLFEDSLDHDSLCSLAGRYDNPIPTRFLAHIDCLKIPALVSLLSARCGRSCKRIRIPFIVEKLQKFSPVSKRK